MGLQGRTLWRGRDRSPNFSRRFPTRRAARPSCSNVAGRIDWQPGQSLTYFLDGKQVAQYTQGVPDVPMELIIDNDVGIQASSGWRTAYDSTTPDPLGDL